MRVQRYQNRQCQTSSTRQLTMTATIFSSATLNDRTTLSPCTREARQTTLTQISYNTSNHSAEAALWYYPPEVTIVATVAMAMAATAGILLNTLLVMTIQFSPSLKTPPNAHLLNICFNNLLLGLHVLVSLPTLHMSGATIRGKTDEVLSGLQLFLVMHCLLQVRNGRQMSAVHLGGWV